RIRPHNRRPTKPRREISLSGGDDTEPATRRGGEHMMAPVIVIVDDRITNRNIFSRLAIAVEPDVTVHAFGDPIEALAWLEENGADLVISDYKMPQMDGADF